MLCPLRRDGPRIRVEGLTTHEFVRRRYTYPATGALTGRILSAQPLAWHDPTCDDRESRDARDPPLPARACGSQKWAQHPPTLGRNPAVSLSPVPQRWPWLGLAAARHPRPCSSAPSSLGPFHRRTFVASRLCGWRTEKHPSRSYRATPSPESHPPSDHYSPAGGSPNAAPLASAFVAAGIVRCLCT